MQTRRPLAANSSREPLAVAPFTPAKSIGSQSLQDVFSQAGLTLPILGGLPFPSATLAPRPDDPLPRGSISLRFLQARSKQASGSAERSRACIARTLAERGPLHTITGGPHTPGRRGEKRRRGSDQKVAGSPSHGADVMTSKMHATHRQPRPSSDTLTRILSTSPASISVSSRCVRLSLPLETAQICSSTRAPRRSNRIARALRAREQRACGQDESQSSSRSSSIPSSFANTACPKPTPTTSPPTTRRAQERGALSQRRQLPHTLQGRRRNVVRIHLSLYLYSSVE